MDFSKTFKLDSKAFEGVSVLLNRMGPMKRAELECTTAAARAKHSEMAARYIEAKEKLEKRLESVPRNAEGVPEIETLPPDVMALGLEVSRTSEECARIMRADVYPAWLRATVKSFEGITVEGDPMTVDVLCEYGPAELFEEVVAAINSHAYLSSEKAENLSLPTTLAAPVDGETKITTAETASSDPSTQNATAESTSPQG